MPQAAPRAPALRAALALALLALLGACDSLAEPDRFYNDQARPPAVAPLDVGGLRPGQHVAGNVRLTLDLDSLRGRVARVVVALDGEELATLTQAPFTFILQTAHLPQGPHVLTVSVHEPRPNGGLLNLAGAPAVFLSTRLVFDQRPPTPVAVTSVEVVGRRARVTWQESADANFYAYLVVRRALWTVAPGSYAWRPVVDTLYDRAATSYLDAPFPDVVGAQATYEVLVWNRREVSPSAGAVEATYGTVLPVLRSTVPTSLSSRDGAETFVTTARGLVAFSTHDHLELRRLGYETLSPFGPFHIPGSLRLDATGSEILLNLSTEQDSYRTRLFALDAATFRVRRSFLLPEQAYVFAPGPSGDVLTAGRGRLFVLDGQTGAVTASSDAVFGDAVVLGVSPDGASVYLASYGFLSGAVVHRVALDGGPLRSAASYAVPGWQRGDPPPRVGDDGRVYVYTHPAATALDGRSLRPLLTFDLELMAELGSRASALHVSSEKLYVAYPSRVQLAPHEYYHGSAVGEFDLGTGRRSRTWTFANRMGQVRTGGSRWLYADTSANEPVTWVVPL